MICKFYQRGFCRFGDACRFSHSDPNSQGDSFQHRNYSPQKYQRFLNPSNYPTNSSHQNYNRPNYSANNYNQQQNHRNYQQPNNYNYQQKNYDVNYQPKNYNSYQNCQHSYHQNQNYQGKEFNKYQYNKNQQGENKDTFISLIEEDNALKLWPLSSYAFIGGAKSFEGFEEHSAEEIRLLHLRAVHENSLPQYLATVEQLIKHNNDLRTEILKPQNRSSLLAFINTSLKELCQNEEEVTRSFYSSSLQNNSSNIFANNITNKSTSLVNNIFASNNSNKNIFASNNTNTNNIFASNNSNNTNIFASNNNNNIFANTNSTNIFSNTQKTSTNIFATNNESSIFPGETQASVVFGKVMPSKPYSFFNSSTQQTINNANLLGLEVPTETSNFNGGDVFNKNPSESNGVCIYSTQMDLDEDLVKEYQSDKFSFIPSIPPSSNLI